jgi:hypothetical protein
MTTLTQASVTDSKQSAIKYIGLQAIQLLGLRLTAYWFDHQQPQKASTTGEGSVVSLAGLEGLLPVPPATTAPTVPARCGASSSTSNPGSSLCGLQVSSTHHSTLDGSGCLLLGPHVAHTEELAGWLSLCRQDSTRQYRGSSSSAVKVSSSSGSSRSLTYASIALLL